MPLSRPLIKEPTPPLPALVLLSLLQSRKRRHDRRITCTPTATTTSQRLRYPAQGTITRHLRPAIRSTTTRKAARGARLSRLEPLLHGQELGFESKHTTQSVPAPQNKTIWK